MALKRALGSPMLTFYGTGMILGAGIYSIIGHAAGIAEDSLWMGFLLASVAVLLTALSYAELVTMYPAAGAEYIYLRHAFPRHRWFASTIGILIIFAGCVSAATVSLAFAGYLEHFIDLPQVFVAGALLIFFTGVNIIGIQLASWTNVVFTIIEVLGLIIFIWLGWQQPQFGQALLAHPTLATVSSAALVIFAFLGFENIVSLAEETIEPEKNIPRAIFLSFTISTLLYILVSLAAVALLPPAELAISDSAIIDASINISPNVARILGGIALFSTANTALIGLITTSRILFGVSKDHSLPRALSMTLPDRKTPWVAALVALISALLILPLGQVETLAGIASFATMIAFISVNAAVIQLRRSQPKAPRSFRIPLTFGWVPVLPIIGIVMCLIFLFQFSPTVYLIGLLALAISSVIHFTFKHFRRS